MDHIEIEGDSADSAIADALHQLGAQRHEVEIEILQNPRGGFLGIGARQARVRVTRYVSSTAAPVIQAVPTAPAARPVTRAVSGAAEIDAAMIERGREVLQTIVGHLGVEAIVDGRREDDHLLLEISGDTSGVLIGRKGQMLDALEYLVGRILTRDEERVVYVVVDSMGYRDRRRQTLEELAGRMAEEARRRGRPVRLNDLSPRDRRIVHLFLQNEPGVSTHSAGEGAQRSLVIAPQAARSGGPR